MSGPVAGEDPKADTACGQIMNGVDQVAQAAPVAIEVPDDQRVGLAKRLEARVQTGPVILLARSMILIEPRGSMPAASSASRWRSSACDPSAFDTRM